MDIIQENGVNFFNAACVCLFIYALELKERMAQVNNEKMKQIKCVQNLLLLQKNNNNNNKLMASS